MISLYREYHGFMGARVPAPRYALHAALMTLAARHPGFYRHNVTLLCPTYDYYDNLLLSHLSVSGPFIKKDACMGTKEHESLYETSPEIQDLEFMNLTDRQTGQRVSCIHRMHAHHYLVSNYS